MRAFGRGCHGSEHRGCWSFFSAQVACPRIDQRKVKRLRRTIRVGATFLLHLGDERSGRILGARFRLRWYDRQTEVLLDVQALHDRSVHGMCPRGRPLTCERIVDEIELLDFSRAHEPREGFEAAWGQLCTVMLPNPETRTHGLRSSFRHTAPRDPKPRRRPCRSEGGQAASSLCVGSPLRLDAGQEEPLPYAAPARKPVGPPRTLREGPERPALPM